MPTTPPIPATNAGAPALLLVVLGVEPALPPAVLVLVKLVVLAVTVVVLLYPVAVVDRAEVVPFVGTGVEDTLWAAE